MNDKNYNIDIEITAKFRVNNAIDIETLDKDFDGDLVRYVKNSLLDDESLLGVAEDEYPQGIRYEVISVEKS